MKAVIRKHLGTALVATLVAMVAAGGIGFAHDQDGGGHDDFAHLTGKLNKVVIKRSPAVDITSGSFKSTQVKCPNGYVVAGGGGVGSPQGVDLHSSRPTDGTGAAGFPAGHTAWRVNFRNNSAVDGQIRAYVTCFKADKVGGNFSPGDDAV